jgi:histidine kinase
VEDDARPARHGALLRALGLRVPLAGGPQARWMRPRRQSAPQLVLLDVRMGQLHGPDLYPSCASAGSSAPVILVTAERDSTLRRQAAERGWAFCQAGAPPALRALISQMLLRNRR